MADSISLLRHPQIGAESTLGTPVAAGKQLQASMLVASEQLDTQVYVGMGKRYASRQTINKDWSQWALTGILSFNEIVYWLSMCYGSATITTPPGGTLSRQWKWIPSLTSAITPTSMTIQAGDTVRAQQVPGCIATGYEFKFTRDTCEVSQPIVGWNLLDNNTLTATPTLIGELPVIGNMVNIYYDTTSAGIGVTQLTRVFELTLGVTDLFGVFWPMNRAAASWTGFADLLPKPTIKIKLGADSNGMQLLADARADTIKYLRIDATGPILEAAIHAEITIDCAVVVLNTTGDTDTQGLVTKEFELQVVDDGAWGQAISLLAINLLTAL